MLQETDTDRLDEGVWMEAGGEKMSDLVTGRCQRVDLFSFHRTTQASAQMGFKWKTMSPQF